MIINYFRYIIRTRVTNSKCVPIKNVIQWVVLVEMSINLRNYLPILILENLQKVGLNQIIFLFLCLFFVVLRIIITTISVVGIAVLSNYYS